MISKEEALKIAEEKTGQKLDIADMEDGVPYNRVYALNFNNVWGIKCEMTPGAFMLESSRLVLIDKETGKVVYDGSAGDEG